MSAYERIVSAIEARGLTVKSNGAKASAQCPAHDDGSPSLSITGIEGQVLLHCHAGCATVDVLAVLDLTMADLYDNPKPRRVSGVPAHAIYQYDNGRTVVRSADKEFRQTGTVNPPELFRLARVRAAVAEGRPVFVVEGEKDVLALEAAGLTATTAPMGAANWNKVDPSPLYGGKVLVVVDQDVEGTGWARSVLAALAGRAEVAVFAPRTGKDAADHLAAGHGVGDFVPVTVETPVPLGGVTVSLADVVPERVDWLWFGRLPLGKIVILDGDPSVGKSTLAVDCAGRVSAGRAWPDGAACRRGNVLLLSAEDGLADTIRPRLDAASGDPSGVHALTVVRYRDEHNVIRTRPVTLADLDEIEDAVRRTKAVLVVVDVLMAFLPGKVDSHRDQDVRGVLSGLAAMAERRGCCILLLRHLNKSAGGSAMYRGGGSIGIIGAARVGLLAAVDPEDESRRVLAGIKSNLAVMPEALGYQLVDSPEHGCARVDWLGATGHTAAALLAGPRDEDERTERDEAHDWLLDYLKGGQWEAPSGQIKKAAHAEGINERTLKRAKAKAKVGHYTTRTSPPTTVWTHPEFQPGQPGQPGHATPTPETRGPISQGGPIEQIRGVQSGQLVQLGQLGHVVSGDPTGDPTRASCPKHPDFPLTSEGKCGGCILDAIAAKTADAVNCTACGYPLDPVIVAEGQSTHPGCDLDDAADPPTEREAKSA